MTTTPYLCESWQGLVQHILSVIGKGYYWFMPIIPKNIKLSDVKWEKADERLIKKFAINTTKDTRYRNKKNNMANYIYVRYGGIACVMRSPGEIREGTESEVFYDIRKMPLHIVISENIKLKIYKSNIDEQFTVYLARESLRSIKAELSELIEMHKIDEVVYRFNMLNNLPAYHGINVQKEDIKSHVLKQAKRCGLKINKDALFVNTKRKIYTVFVPIAQSCMIDEKDLKKAKGKDDLSANL